MTTAFMFLLPLLTISQEPKEPMNLMGTYKLESVERNGEKQPDKKYEGDMVRITEDRIIATDKDSKQTYVATYKLNSSTNPWTLSMKSVVPTSGMDARGLVKRDGDTIWLIYQQPGGEVPTEFKTKDKQLMVVLKKVTK